jgi:hypothetical protein
MLVNEFVTHIMLITGKTQKIKKIKIYIWRSNSCWSLWILYFNINTVLQYLKIFFALAEHTLMSHDMGVRSFQKKHLLVFNQIGQYFVVYQ